jgi:hypothetical protein
MILVLQYVELLRADVIQPAAVVDVELGRGEEIA